MEHLELQLVREGELVLLTSPGVGRLSCARGRGEVLVPGQKAGVLSTLERSVPLHVPARVTGRIVSADAGMARRPVEFGETIYELERVGDDASRFEPEPEEATSESGLFVRAAQGGRFYHRPGPGEDAFVGAGSALEDGTTLGLIEIMKTFNQVHYRPGGDLPARARVVRFVVGDGSDVGKGDALLEVEPADDSRRAGSTAERAAPRAL